MAKKATQEKELPLCNIKHIDFDFSLLAKILDSCQDEIFITDSTGTTLYANKAFEKHYGVKVHEIIGKKAWQLAEKGLCSASPIPLVIAEKKEFTIEQETATGNKLIVTATPIFNEEGEIEYIVENCRDITELTSIKHNLEETRRLLEKYQQEIKMLRKKDLVIGDLLFHSKKMKILLNTLQRIAQTDSTILLLGETGTGKSVLARYIHSISGRKDGPFITINCATIPESLFESELFGYSTGAFTGACKGGKIGLIELAHGGTLFLDEIGEVPFTIQAKLLELIQNRHFLPVGSTTWKNIDVRIIAATNRDLNKLVNEKKFREDLYYRLKVFDIEIPPLRERPEDVLPLLNLFLDKYNAQYKVSHQFSRDTLDILLRYNWPGNIRELQHLVERLVVTVNEKIIQPKHLSANLHPAPNSLYNLTFNEKNSLDEILEKVEREIIIKAYKQFGSTYKVAKALNISQSKASRKIRKYISQTDKTASISD
ncbi:sigma-54 interaction domain-containing protein [Neomoorella humiferrea]|uniref:HTH-type transcriptional regulatory protein TyrR n=1 Tax=Neomoorella humiferrea TaxID=676965 RepID=A0A2T0AYS7_9FIRM|nr:sigma 54-interacting transcriptional regulator [Moorella humiferrea]PRR76165.1 Alginate biosynthesis transcriptional regulatory protein AlgB [Moorella humiferrea]